MQRLGFVFATLTAACASPDATTATFHGSVGTAVTHVMAVSPVDGDLQKVVVPTSDGEFSVEVEPGRPWALVFVDANRTGAKMVTGVLRSDTLDTFLPEAAGEVELGYISFDGREATMAGSSNSLDTALGLSRRTLATLGGLDDIALRYANPDIDGDGLLDIDQGHVARLELHVEYELTAAGRAAIPDDFIVRPQQMGYDHVGTGIYGRLPDQFAPVDRETASVTFGQPFYGYAYGPFTAPVKAGQPVTDLTYGDSRTFGVFARPDHPVPYGDYHFQSGDDHLDFTLVRPPTEMLRHQVMPRIRFVPKQEGCTSQCAIDSIAFTWARNTDDGWIALTTEEASALQPAGSIDVLSTSGHRHYELPPGYASGTLTWDQDLYLASTITTGNITYVNIAFQTGPGMKMYASMGDGTGPTPLHVPSFDAVTR